MTKENSSPAAQPLFYKDPVPLLLDRHADAGLSTKVNYAFAKSSNSVPINMQEFAEVAKHYPIAFTADQNALPVAILGIEDQKNLFVSDKGEWKEEVYIPAYARRYPFALSQNGDSLVLCVDEASNRYKNKATKNESKFFNGQEQSDLTKNVLNFCVQYHRDSLGGAAFSKALVDNNLLIPRQANIQMKNGKNISLGGFQVIDENKFVNIDANLLKEWQRNGYLALIYFHFLSVSNWSKLADLVAKE